MASLSSDSGVWSSGGDSCTFCHWVRGAIGSDGAACGDLRGSGNIAVQREDRREGGEENWVSARDKEKTREMDRQIQGPAKQ